MRNELDKMECTPTEGGRKPPYSIFSHPYCVDIIKAYVQVSSLTFKGKESYLKSLEDAIKNYCLYHNIDFAYHFINKLPITIHPRANNFQWHLAMLIIGFDINKINALLSFQQKRYPENEETDFITFVEFGVYDIVRSWSLFDNSVRLELIMKWVDEQRKDKTCSHENLTDAKSETTILNKNNVYIQHYAPVQTKSKKGKEKPRTDNSFMLIDFGKDEEYFTNKNKDIKTVFNQLKGGGFIAPETAYPLFVDIFSNKKIKPDRRVDWIPKILSLKAFINILIDLKKINPKYKWEVAIKCFTKGKLDIEPTSFSNSNGKLSKEETDKLKEILQKL